MQRKPIFLKLPLLRVSRAQLLPAKKDKEQSNGG